MTRKHLYLITEHIDDDRVGCLKITDTRLSSGEKNKETPITKLDDDKRDYSHVGKQVHCGYIDFESEAAYENAEWDTFTDKIKEIDRRWAQKANIDDTVYQRDTDE
jgi:hypothetical protein